MKTFKLSNFTRGWIMGDFEPSLIKTKNFEVKVITYPKGYVDKRHVHRIADEIGVVISGSCKINGTVFTKGDICWTAPGEWVSFETPEECAMTVIKIPSVKGDKYYEV